MGQRRTDREAITTEYISTDISMRGLARKRKVALSTLKRWAEEDDWPRLKQEFWAQAAQQARRAADTQRAQLLGEVTDRWTRMYTTADKLLEKVDELLALEGDPLAPRDLKSISSVLVDIMTLHSAGEKREEAAEQGGDAFVIEIVEADADA